MRDWAFERKHVLKLLLLRINRKENRGEALLAYSRFFVAAFKIVKKKGRRKSDASCLHCFSLPSSSSWHSLLNKIFLKKLGEENNTQTNWKKNEQKEQCEKVYVRLCHRCAAFRLSARNINNSTGKIKLPSLCAFFRERKKDFHFVKIGRRREGGAALHLISGGGGCVT